VFEGNSENSKERSKIPKEKRTMRIFRIEDSAESFERLRAQKSADSGIRRLNHKSDDERCLIVERIGIDQKQILGTLQPCVSPNGREIDIECHK